jgi:hypothetical protein
VSVSIPFEVRSANLIGEWVAEDGTVIQSDRLAVDGASIVLELGQGSMGTGLRPDGVRLYVWDEERGVDGIAWAEVGAGGGPDRSAAVDDAIAATRGGVAAERTGGGGGR